MSMMGVDDGGASGDIVVVADVPLRHVDQMVVAQTVRCVGHAGKTKIGAVRQDCGQQRRFVRRQIASTQMGEPIGIPGPAIDIAENLGDTHPWHAFSRMARSRAASGTAGLARAMYNVPSSISTPSRSPRAARAITKFSRSCSAAARSFM